MNYITRSGTQLMLDGKVFKPGFYINFYPFLVDNVGVSDVIDIMNYCRKNNISLIRTWLFDQGRLPSNTAGNFRYLSGGALVWREAQLVLLDTLMYYANIYGIKLMFALADNNSTGYDTKTTYIRWCDAIYGTTYYNQTELTVNSALRSGTTVTVTTAASHGYITGNLVSVIGPTLAVTSIIRVGSTATVLTSTNHGLITGNVVQIRGAVESDYNTAGADTGVKVITVTGLNTFTYDVSNSPSTPATGTITARFYSGDAYGYFSNFITVTSPTTFTYQSSITPPVSGVVSYRSITSQAFFDDSNCQQMYKDFFYTIANRTNTLNGRVYKNDPTWNFTNLGNELRFDQSNDPGINGTSSHNLTRLSKSGGWADIMSTYMKSVAPNILISFGGMEHRWEYSSGDVVANGTYSGVDDGYLSALTNIDILDVHIYPTQGGDGTQLQRYGQNLGYPDAISAAGFWAQVNDWVSQGVANDKVVFVDEIGFSKDVVCSNTYLTLSPRPAFLEEFGKRFFSAGGSAVGLWHATTDQAGASYSIVLNGYNGIKTNVNSNDIPIMEMINRTNGSINNRRSRII